MAAKKKAASKKKVPARQRSGTESPRISADREVIVEVFRRWTEDAEKNPDDYLEEEGTLEERAEGKTIHFIHLVDVVSRERLDSATVTDAGEDNAEDGLLAG